MKIFLVIMSIFLITGCGKLNCEKLASQQECLDALECMPIYNQGCEGCDKDPRYLGCAYKDKEALKYAEANKELCLKTGGDWNDINNACRCNALASFEENKGCIPN